MLSLLTVFVRREAGTGLRQYSLIIGPGHMAAHQMSCDSQTAQTGGYG